MTDINENENILVFVYGSLKKGFENHHHLSMLHSKFIGETVSEPLFSMVSVEGLFPAVLKLENSINKICGEIYEICPRTFKRLDRLENYPYLYQREQFEFIVEGFSYKAWMYFGNESFRYPTTTDCYRLQNQDGCATWGPRRMER